MGTEKTVFLNGRIFTTQNVQDGRYQFQQCMVVAGTQIEHVGNEADEIVQQAKQEEAEVVDLQHRVVVPGFIDAHVHLLYFGLSLRKLDLSECKSLAAIQSSIAQWAETYPDLPRILCRGWHQPSTDGCALASMLDGIDPRPIFVEALDLHSTWCNTAALEELPIDEIKATCGEFASHDASGNLTGLLAERAQMEFVWPHLANITTTEAKQEALKAAFDSYVAAGYTGAIDMAMDKDCWEALDLYRKTRGIPLHVAAHWFIPSAENKGQLERHVNEAMEMHRKWHPSKSPEFCIVGIKIIADGIVDGCTAALSYPYGEHKEIVPPLWPREAMEQVVNKAVEAGLQVAIHAIGDVAITQAINSIASANSNRGRHRIEHLELATLEDARRLGELGITASVQPVHSDPSLQQGYHIHVGAEMLNRAFPYREFLQGNACVAIGTDAPTARHHPLPNLYNATTRKSALEPELPVPINADNVLTLSQAFSAATAGAAYSRFAETWTGSLTKGLRADFLVLDTEWTSETLLEASVNQTWSRGRKLFQV